MWLGRISWSLWRISWSLWRISRSLRRISRSLWRIVLLVWRVSLVLIRRQVVRYRRLLGLAMVRPGVVWVGHLEAVSLAITGVGQGHGGGWRCSLSGGRDTDR